MVMDPPTGSSVFGPTVTENPSSFVSPGSMEGRLQLIVLSAAAASVVALSCCTGRQVLDPGTTMLVTSTLSGNSTVNDCSVEGEPPMFLTVTLNAPEPPAMSGLVTSALEISNSAAARICGVCSRSTVRPPASVTMTGSGPVCFYGPATTE